LGPDRPHPGVLRELADGIVRLLLTILEWSCQLAEVPEVWKREDITPIFKTGKKKDLEN